MYVMSRIFSPGVHGAHRQSNQRLPTLPHVLQGLGKSFGVIAIPNECPKGRAL